MLRPPSRLRHPRGAATGGRNGASAGAEVPPVETAMPGLDRNEATPTATTGDPVASAAPAGPRLPPLTTVRRPGTYVMTDPEGTEVGVIQGDYVIGFTARYLGRARFIKDLDEAKAEITRAWLSLGDPDAGQPRAG